MTRRHTWREAGLSLPHSADLFNAEGVLARSGRGRWQKATAVNLLHEGREAYDKA